MSQEPENKSPINEPQDPQIWEPKYKLGPVAVFSRLLLLLIIATVLILPFTPYAGKIQRGLKDIVSGARETTERIVTKDRVVTKEVPVTKEVIKEVIKEVPAPPPPLPEKYIPRKEVDVATLYNGITVKTDLLTEQGTYASLERLDPEAYKVQFQLSIRVPKANQSLPELQRINPNLPAMLPGLAEMLASSKVSPFYHKLYDNKTNVVERDLTRLNKILDRHNFFDCETILELSHPATQRKALLIQSEMDVVADGSDGDRMDKLDDYISMSDYYQPFTSYAWAKKTKTPNPLLARWEGRLAKAKEEKAKKDISTARSRELKSAIDQLTLEIKDLKARSSLIADKDPFIVNSLLFKPYIGSNKHAPQIGDYAVVIHDKKIYPAICGDYGPTMKMGEASLFLAKAINEKATPYRRPESDLRVTYLIFPGTAEKPFAPPNLAKWREKCAEFLKEVGGIGAGFELHEWVDPFKKPESPPIDATAATTAPTPPATTPADAAKPADGPPPADTAKPNAEEVKPAAPASAVSNKKSK